MRPNLYDAKTLPPCPWWIPTDRRKLWAASWRDLWRFHRWQMTESARFHRACHDAAPELTAQHLGPEDQFNLKRWVQLNEVL